MDEKFQTPLQRELAHRLAEARERKQARAKPEEREQEQMSDAEHFKAVMDDPSAWTGYRLQ